MLIPILGALFATAVAAPAVLRRWPRAAGPGLAAIPALAFVYFLTLVPRIGAGEVVRAELAWLPEAGVSIALAVDGLSLVFALLVTGLGALVILYASSYLAGDRGRGRFAAALIGFMAAMLGLVLADDLIALFVFWELTGIASFVLIGHKHTGETARRAARQALVVTGGGGLALLAGLLLLSAAAGGTFSITEILDRGDLIRAHPLYEPAFVLIALGAFTKSAQFPFHAWLPGAMAAPTPASAYLHSATMVKAGIYLLARTERALGDTQLWTWTLVVVGVVTMMLGAVSALRQVDLKRILAYSTITALGGIVVLLGLGFPASVKAAVVFVLVHALYKGALFMIAGIIERRTGTRDVRQLRGLASTMPWTAAAATLAGLSMAGLPPVVGFMGKELAYKAKLGFDAGGWLLPAFAVAANALTAAAAAVIVVRPFFGSGSTAHPRAAPAPGLNAGPLILAGLGLALGLAPHLAAPLIGPAADAVTGAPVTVHLALWYGATPALWMSAITIGLGAAVYAAWCRWHGRAVARSDERAGFDRLLDAIARVATRTANAFEGASPAGAVSWALLLLAVMVAVATLGGALPAPVSDAIAPIDVVLAVGLCATAIAAVAARTPLTMLLLLGATGLLMSLWFVVLGAFDLAMTQLLVETLVIVVALGAIRRSPDRFVPAARAERRRHALIAIAAGAAVALLTLAVIPLEVASPAADYYVANAVTEAHGRNVVNVILVDFRALDTLGEIAVLLLGLLAVRALAPRSSTAPAPSPSIIVSTAARALVPLLAIAALLLLLRGHNQPGGGFIAGLVAVCACLVKRVAAGDDAMRSMLRVSSPALAAIGLALALVAATSSALVGADFFTGLWIQVGGLALGTPLLFDAGVFLLVLGFGTGVIAPGGSREATPCS